MPSSFSEGESLSVAPVFGKSGSILQVWCLRRVLLTQVRGSVGHSGVPDTSTDPQLPWNSTGYSFVKSPAGQWPAAASLSHPSALGLGSH